VQWYYGKYATSRKPAPTGETRVPNLSATCRDYFRRVSQA